MSYKCISIDEAKELIDKGEVTLADVRDGRSFSDANISNAVHITQDNVDEFLMNANKAQPLIIYCYHGNSSKGAADYFASQGFNDVSSMDGGFEAWRVKYT
ncbi:MAG: thiosulfate sulfurtransferase [Oleiphilaceae bacterium]|jgi:thiosulfate sulfurtransferase